MFGSWGNTDHDECIRIVRKAVDAGINFIDTADVYSSGESEEIVGKALADIGRDNIVLATKVHGQMGRDANTQGNSRRWIITECENSLKRLGTDHIDLYQIHRPEPDTDIDETLGALSDLVHSGKIRYAGSSTFPAHQVVEAQWVAERRNRERFVTEQPPYSILTRAIEADLLPVCGKYGMGVLSWSPLAGGWLSGRFGKGKDNTSRRAERIPARYDLALPGNQQKVEVVSELAEIASAAGNVTRGARDRLRAGASAGDLPDHRTPHDGSARCGPSGRRHPTQRRDPRPNRQVGSTRDQPECLRRRLGATFTCAIRATQALTRLDDRSVRR